MENQLPWNLIVGALLSLVGGLIIFYLRSIKQTLDVYGERTDRNEGDIKTLTSQVTTCKIDCQRTTVSKEDWVRSEGYTRIELKQISQSIAKLAGQLEIAAKLPELCGKIAQQIVQAQQPSRQGDICNE